TSGNRSGPTHPAAHRFPVWWTGDTSSDWSYLEKAVVNGIDGGTIDMLPYINDDAGGFQGKPTTELFVRFLQYAALCPVTRVHSNHSPRFPWDYGADAETIVGDFVRLRYRLLPTLYSAARALYDDGAPI